MPRTAISPLAYVEAWKTQDYNTIHEATKAEASRQVNEMVKWMEWQIQYDPDQMKKIHLEQGTFELVRKARNYRSTIYNRNKAIVQAGFEVPSPAVAVKLSEYEDDQWVAARRILKVYIHVKFKAGGTLELTEPEDVEYEYDPEEA